MAIKMIFEFFSRRNLTNVLEEDDKLTVDDVSKIIGCYKALRDRGQEPSKQGEAPIMRRAVGFANTIKASKDLKERFQRIVTEQDEIDNARFTCETDHVDGTMSALERTQKLDWLRQDPGGSGDGGSDDGDICNILFNARCLTEGVDVPALDAVMFMQPPAAMTTGLVAFLTTIRLLCR